MKRILIHVATILTLDPRIGDLRGTQRRAGDGLVVRPFGEMRHLGRALRLTRRSGPVLMNRAGLLERCGEVIVCA